MAVSKLPGQAGGVKSPFPPGEVASFARGFAGAVGVDRFLYDLFRHGRIHLKVSAQFVVDERDHGALNVAVEFALSLAFKLRLRELDTHNSGEAFADIIAAEVLFNGLEKFGALSVGVDGARERGTEAGQVRATVNRVDRVGEAVDVLGVAVVVLQSHLHRERAVTKRFFVRNVNRVGV